MINDPLSLEQRIDWAQGIFAEFESDERFRAHYFILWAW